MTEETMIVRLTKTEYEAIAGVADLLATPESVMGRLRTTKFDRPFEPSPKVIGEATDLIEPWRKLRGLIGRNGPVTISITGAQGSGKSLIARAVETSLNVVGIKPTMITFDGERRLRHGPAVSAPVIIEDKQ